MRYLTSILLLFALLSGSVYAQITRGFTVKAMVVDEDTILMDNLPQIIIKDKRIFKSKRQAVRYNRLVRNVKRVYPYSKLAASLLHKYSDTLLATEDKRQRRKLMKKAEKELWDKYGDELKKMTMSQGLILIKLIDRETGSTSFDLVQELRGNFTAFIFQGLARLFHLNLKSQYNDAGEDQRIEDIVLLIEQGDI
ncbi:MAG: DUF4294 domain-containing protein [Flavobacteriales bacterium]|nr:DUF4294 domain-containing protein [Flavobacteriales bacterium]